MLSNKILDGGNRTSMVDGIKDIVRFESTRFCYEKTFLSGNSVFML